MHNAAVKNINKTTYALNIVTNKNDQIKEIYVGWSIT